MDWTDALQSASQAQGYDEVKKALPITFVVERVLGQDVEISSDGKGHTACPFHADSSPSLDIFGEHMERWGCYPCGIGGDVFDLLRRYYRFTFPQALERAGELLKEKIDSGWTGPSGITKRTLDLDTASRLVDSSQTDLTGLADFLGRRGVDFTAEQLAGAFKVGSVGASVVIPYFTADGSLATYKHRTSGTKALAAPGSKFDGLLYGDWRDEPSKPVLLTEGESDAWSAAYYLSKYYSVLGLPTGTGTQPDKFVERFKGRLVVLAFDGDDPGRSAMRRWAAALGRDAVRVVMLPEGTDLASLGEGLIERVQSSRAIPAPPSAPLSESGYAYFRLGSKDTLLPVSNWVFHPRRELTDEHGNLAYEGLLLPQGKDVTITSGDLSTAARTLAWAARHGGSWYGTDKDSRTLLGQLQAEGPFLEPAKMSAVAGLHQDQFVYPGGHIGTSVWRYVPAGADAKLAERVFIKPGPVKIVEMVQALRALHRPEVMDPILAWLAAAPLRSIRPEFPILAITGSSGSGKTTLTDAVLRAFTGTLISTNLTGTTRYGIEALVGATNAFPVWVDEYRPGARADTAMAFQQILRDAYTGQGSVRGGSQENWAALSSSPVIAPMVVTGENAFEETSHLERMVSIHLPRSGRNPDALSEVQRLVEAGPGAFAYAYLSWLAGTPDLPGPSPAQLPDGVQLSPRQVLNLGRLQWGWHLLDRFVQAKGGDDLGRPAFEGVIETALLDASSSPIEDALGYAQGSIDGTDFLFPRGDILWVQVADFVRFCYKTNTPLPGNEKAVRRFLIERYAAVEGSIEVGGLTKKCIGIRVEDL